MKRLALFICVVMATLLSFTSFGQGSTPRNPGTGGNKCGYVKIIPNSPNPLRVICQNTIVAGCGGYCATHCVRNLTSDSTATFDSFMLVPLPVQKQVVDRIKQKQANLQTKQKV